MVIRFKFSDQFRSKVYLTQQIGNFLVRGIDVNKTPLTYLC